MPYKGTTPAMGDLLAGRLTFIFSGVGHVLAKLGVTDRTQAAVLAVQHGLTTRS